MHGTAKKKKEKEKEKILDVSKKESYIKIVHQRLKQKSSFNLKTSPSVDLKMNLNIFPLDLKSTSPPLL